MAADVVISEAGVMPGDGRQEAVVPTQKQLVTYGFLFGGKIPALRDFQRHW